MKFSIIEFSCLRFVANRLKFFFFRLSLHVPFNELLLYDRPILLAQQRMLATTPMIHQAGSVEPSSARDRQDDDRDDTSSVSSDVSDMSESDEDDTTRAERFAREEKERHLVLQAAGLIVTEETEPPPPQLVRVRSSRKRRPAPPTPQRLSTASSITTKDLPPIPEPEPDSSTRVDDAFDRYEAFKLTHGNVNRLSVASIDTLSPPASVTQSPSRDSESRSGTSSFLNFLGRKTPAIESERRMVLNISGPIMINPTPPSRANSPAFGTVSYPAVISAYTPVM